MAVFTKQDEEKLAKIEAMANKLIPIIDELGAKVCEIEGLVKDDFINPRKHESEALRAMRMVQNYLLSLDASDEMSKSKLPEVSKSKLTDLEQKIDAAGEAVLKWKVPGTNDLHVAYVAGHENWNAVDETMDKSFADASAKLGAVYDAHCVTE